MTQNFIPKTSTILYSITKGISKIYQLEESNGSLKSFRSIKVQSYNHLYSFIHSLICENDKNVPLIVCEFQTKCGKRTHLAFWKRRYQGFISKILKVVGLLGEKFTFNFLGTTKISKSIRVSVYINVVLVIKSPEQFELCLCFKYSRSYKVL